MTLIIDQQPATQLATRPAELNIFDAPVFEQDTQRWMDWIEAYHAWLESKRRRSGGKNTVRTYDTAWRQFFRWAQVKPWEVTARLAEQWTAWLTNQLQLKETTVNLKVAALSSYYSYAQRQYRLDVDQGGNPFGGVERYQINPYGNSHYPTSEEALAILASINRKCLTGARDYAILYTFYVTCRRSSEILNLRFGDIEQTETGYAFTTRLKGGEVKKYDLPKLCYEAIEKYLELAGRTLTEDDYLFVALDDRANRLPTVDDYDPNSPLTNSHLNQALKKYARRAGIDPKKAHLHGLRHAGARERYKLMKSGQIQMDLLEIKHILNHKSIATTQIYIDTILDDPTDNAAHLVARQTALKIAKTHKKPSKKKIEEGQLSFDTITPEQQEIAILQAEIARLKKQLNS